MWRNRSPCKQKSPHLLLIKRLYLKNEPGDPQLLFLKGNQQAQIKLPAKFGKIIWSGFRATLKFSSCEDGYMNPRQRILFNFAESLIWAS